MLVQGDCVALKSPRQAKRASKSVTTERPKELTEVREKEETTTRDVSILLYTLKRVFEEQAIDKIHYFKFIIDPESFSHTVENIFHFAFLIKEGRAGLIIENGEPYIHLNIGGGEATGGTNQGIISINMKMWKDLIDKYDITESMIKKRQ
uniref:Non-structural maintenance of chromosomes element 4 n=2 Tax=Amphimedon queenslandica TaxID=400682 RepID=A0A1X7TDA1_AMPQE